MNFDVPPFAMLELELGDQNIELIVMSRGKRFHVQLATEDLRGSQADHSLLHTFLKFRESMDDDPQAMEELMDWMMEPCTCYINQLAPPQHRLEPPSLAEYFDPETFIFKLMNVDGHLEAIRCPENHSPIRSATPKVSISDPTVSAAIAQGVDCISASILSAALEPDVHEADYDLVPRRVRIIGQESQFHFKGAFEEQSFQRELDILLRFRSDSLPNDLLVSRLGGLVTHDDGLSVMGILIEYVHGSKTLDFAVEEASMTEREKWAWQIRTTIKQLHDANITWGDVKPDNVLIDPNGDALVIDFGGGCVEGWVDQNLEGTREGDLQGLANIEQFLGL
ncbi:hypothetical protein BDV95DRAFT_179749 [Massariosphaeria phaeospora]|uniref:Protein kinase domain-containing protein n=1 Tax=Massariosphaeria phaeospora TaxID=100035 RepID=A0A7C8I3T9_9PLEO|nr:hypothetical protein BDV95DRAFT_179749 [Massariosphaeria phaeospora]